MQSETWGSFGLTLVFFRGLFTNHRGNVGSPLRNKINDTRPLEIPLRTRTRLYIQLLGTLRSTILTRNQRRGTKNSLIRHLVILTISRCNVLPRGTKRRNVPPRNSNISLTPVIIIKSILGKFSILVRVTTRHGVRRLSTPTSNRRQLINNGRNTRRRQLNNVPRGIKLATNEGTLLPMRFQISITTTQRRRTIANRHVLRNFIKIIRLSPTRLYPNPNGTFKVFYINLHRRLIQRRTQRYGHGDDERYEGSFLHRRGGPKAFIPKFLTRE